MQVFLNGEEREIRDGQTVQELVEALGLDPARVAVELDREIVGRTEWAARVIAPGARIEMVHFVGGG